MPHRSLCRAFLCRSVTLHYSVHPETIRGDAMHASLTTLIETHSISRPTLESDATGKSFFAVITDIYAPREGSLIGSFSLDACGSIRTCRLCGLRGHCLRVEVTCNSRPIYRLFIPQNEIGRLDAHCAHYLLSGPVSPRLHCAVVNIANVLYRERIGFRKWMSATEMCVQRSEKSDFNKRDNTEERVVELYDELSDKENRSRTDKMLQVIVFFCFHTYRRR